jgi:hypothetical protein
LKTNLVIHTIEETIEMDALDSVDTAIHLTPAERHYENHKKANLAYRLRKNPNLRVGQRGRPPGSKNRKGVAEGGAQNECVSSKE